MRGTEALDGGHLAVIVLRVKTPLDVLPFGDVGDVALLPLAMAIHGSRWGLAHLLVREHSRGPNLFPQFRCSRDGAIQILAHERTRSLRLQLMLETAKRLSHRP